MIEKTNIEKTNAWPFVEAKKILRERKKLIEEKGKIIFASHPAKNTKIRIDPHDLIKGKKIIGSWGGGTLPKKDIVKIFKLFKKNNINFYSFFKSRYNFYDINRAISDFKSGKSIRPLIKMTH